MDLSKAQEKWNALYEQWHEAHQIAREARHEVTQAFVRCAAGQGTGPTTEQIERAERWERIAEEKRYDEAEFLRQVFGR
jgi:hypothetical protein